MRQYYIPVAAYKILDMILFSLTNIAYRQRFRSANLPHSESLHLIDTI